MHAHDRPMTPPSAAVKALMTVLTIQPQTPRFDPQIHISSENVDIDSKEEKEDSFIEKIESRTPAAMTQTEPCEDVQAEDAQPNGDCLTLEKDDSFVEQIIVRSPAKSVIRIEDSVEAIDALEEAIEKIGESIPAVDEELRSPQNNRKQNIKPVSSAQKPASRMTLTPGKTHHDRMVVETARFTRKSATDSKRKVSNTPRVLRTNAPVSTKPTIKRTTQPSTTATRASVLKLSKPVDSAQPAMDSTNVPAEANRKVSNVGVKRVSSITKAPFVPIKSTKPLTRSSFVLPGEAIAQKLKKQREKRLKFEEENKPPTRTFKARPAPTFTAPVVKSTTASKARLSMAKNDASANTAALAKDHAPKIKPLRRQSSAETNKCQSTLKVANRTTPVAANVLATRKSIAAKISSPEDVTPPTGASRQTSRGKEVFQRSRLEKGEKERVQKEKEAAARKARVDAAERGRIASREWAEKQKAKKMEKGGSERTRALVVE